MTPARIARTLGALRRDLRGLAMIEFAFGAPLILLLGMCGIEMANYALVRMRISQVSMNIADNASRVGLDTGLSTFQMTEGDVNDTIIGAAISGKPLDLLTRGRIIISSLEMNAQGGQWSHWQRCKGAKVVDSAYGNEGTGITGTAFAGMGPASARVTSTSTSTAVMYVELFYDYPPLFPLMWSNAPDGKFLGAIFNNTLKSIKYGNSFMVRDNRDLNVDAARNSGKGIFNPNNLLTNAPEPVSSCTVYTA